MARGRKKKTLTPAEQEDVKKRIRRAVEKYKRQNIEKINVNFVRGSRELIQKRSEELGVCISAYIKGLIKIDMEKAGYDFPVNMEELHEKEEKERKEKEKEKKKDDG